MSSIVADRSKPADGASAPSFARDHGLDVAAVVVGTVLIVVAAINQPYNQNELQQILPYDSSDVAEIVGATRQPPLDPLLGALLQHVLGEGQLRQRLVPVLAGIGSLIVLAFLLRRLRAGAAGTIGLWMMATAPLVVRYSAYARPYALPMFLMVLFVYAAQSWLDDRKRGWLVVSAVAAVAMPLARVPEPTIFLLVTAATLAVASVRGQLTWSQTRPLVAISGATLVLVCYPLYHLLASQSGGIWDPSPSGVMARFGAGVHEVLTGLLPLLASWLPWWPVTLIITLAALAIPDSRRRVFHWWFFWPLLAGPAVFAVAYHFMNPFPFEVRPYRARMAIFFVPAFILLVVALAQAVTDGVTSAARTSQRVKVAVAALVAAVLLGQLPATARVLVNNEAPDYSQVADVLTQRLPSNAIILYDTASAAGQWRQPFSARPRYMGYAPYVGQVATMMHYPEYVPKHGPVYVLLLDSACAISVVCDEPRAVWSRQLHGWDVAARFDKFTLYKPQVSLSGRSGVITALEQFGRAMGPDLGYVQTFSAASLLQFQGHPRRGRALVRRMYRTANLEAAIRIAASADKRGLDPFRRDSP